MALKNDAEVPWFLQPPYFTPKLRNTNVTTIGQQIEPHNASLPVPDGYKRIRITADTIGTADGLRTKLFKKGEIYDLPMGPHPKPDFGAVVLEQKWGEEVKEPEAQTEPNGDMKTTTSTHGAEVQPTGNLDIGNQPKVTPAPFPKSDTQVSPKGGTVSQSRR